MIASKSVQSAKIVVVTRTKNRNILLERAIQSVEAQTFADYIHVIVNDGGEKEEVDDLASKYENKRRLVIHNKESIGLTQALNQGIKAVNTDYISILDDDDSLHEDRLKLAVEFLEENKSSHGIVNMMDRIVEEIDNNEVREISRDRWHDGVCEINLYKQCLDNYLSNGAVTYRRSVYDELNGYDETLPAAEDWDFGVRFLLKYDVDFLLTSHALSYYHHRPDQKGDSGNSVFAGIDRHKYALNQLQNKYLRQDITSGKLGVGYIMNNLRYERERDELGLQEDIKLVTRLEGHINLVADEVIETTTRKVVDSLPSTKARARLNAWLRR